ncbi:MAG: hypothetical protein II556_05305, partial [Bacteroidales bacterium]|nr:hypothetical protein [Bacteroidales bacterium]
IKRSVPYIGDSIKSYSVGDYYFVEMRFARSGKSYLQTSGTAYLGTVIYYGKYTNEDDSSGTEHSYYMYAPSTNSGMLEVTMPDYVTP